jgi:Fur family zinc uptake transcriptional regulator
MAPPQSDRDVLAPFRSDDHDHGACVDDALAAAEAVCKSRGARLTALRRQVLEFVWGRHGPVRAYDILDRLSAGGRRAAPPTVYRALEFLLDAGLIHRIESLNAYVGCGDPFGAHGGQFLICEACGSVAEIDDAAISRGLSRRASGLGFRVRRQTVEILGLCAPCGTEHDGDGA